VTGKAKAGALNGFLDSGARFEGTLSFDDVFRIDGHFRGVVVSESELVVGDRAVIEPGIRSLGYGEVFVIDSDGNPVK